MRGLSLFLWSIIPFALLIGLILLIIIFQVQNYESGTYEPDPCFREGECCEDCLELGKEYYRQSKEGFGSVSCWCKEGNNTVRIW